MLYTYFFGGVVIISISLFFLAIWGKRQNKLFVGFFSTPLLFFSFFVFGLGLFEFMFLTFPKLKVKKESFPEFLYFDQAPTHILLKKSILYVNPPNKRFRTLRNKVSTNRLGFRERDFLFKKPKGVFRILVFGASYTYGQAVSVDQRFSNQLEGLLNDQKKEMRFEVLNFGMPGYTYDQIYELMKVILGRVDCDLIILAISGSELHIATQKRLVGLTSLGIFDSRVYEETEFPKIFENLKRNLSNIPSEEPESFLKPVSWIQATQIYQAIDKRTRINENGQLPNPARWQAILKEFKGMRKLAKQHALEPILAVLLYQGAVDPKKNDFLHPKGDLAKNIRLLQFIGNQLQKENFSVADPMPLFKKYKKMSLAVSEWDAHPNYLTHYIYARSILPIINSVTLNQ